MDHRPDPDQILKSIYSQQEKSAQPRGKLKIFFGYAAGVGKTYAMLEAAHAALHAGVDVVVGYIEPHTRPETLALLDGLERLPIKDIAHRGITLHEFDLDAALARRPALILVDELAHTNAEGMRHKKRYQDIEELLKAGINVLTTINVQHLESLNDIVASITEVLVRERVPDSVFDSADQVELVDIEPEELIERFKQGKIYAANQAERALDHFFVPGNLVALREIALRRTADRVNRRAEEKRPQAPESPYYTEEHILICLSSSPSNSRVIRTAARMAGAFHGTFTALFVETPHTKELEEKNLKRLRENLRLAEQLGARIATVFGDDIAVQIAEYAKASGVSKIIIGRSNSRRRLFMRSKTLVERLCALAPSIDMYIIPDSLPRYRTRLRPIASLPPFSRVDAVKTLVILAATSILGILFRNAGFSEANIVTVYILGVLLTSAFTSGWVYGAAASIVNVLTFNFLFTAPRFSLQFYDPGYLVTFAVMFIAAFITSSLTLRVKAHARQTARKAYRTEILLETSQKLQQARSRSEIMAEIAKQLEKLMDCSILIYPAEGEQLTEALFYPCADETRSPEFYTGDDERAVAQWVLRNNKHAGATTDTLPGAKCLYMAVRSHDTVFAVVGIGLVGKPELEAYEKNLLLALLGECALAMEKEALREEQNRTALEAQREQLRANLLRAISHDLRTPLTSISGNAGVLLASGEELSGDKRRALYTDIYEDAEWLINLVENLLSVTRIENGAMSIRMEPELLSEIVPEALRHLGRKTEGHSVRFEEKDELLMASMDARLIVQLVVNIVDNALKFTPRGSAIRITAAREGERVRISIADDGPGIDDEAKLHLFDMFYTMDNQRSDGRRGLGLGLALCKSIAAAHGSELTVADNRPHGAIFSFTLPVEEVENHA